MVKLDNKQEQEMLELSVQIMSIDASINQLLQQRERLYQHLRKRLQEISGSEHAVLEINLAIAEAPQEAKIAH